MGSIPNNSAAAEAKPPERVLQDWIVRDGHALVENRYGGIFDVTGGSILPGLGRVWTIKRQDGQWVVVTAHGLIISATLKTRPCVPLARPLALLRRADRTGSRPSCPLAAASQKGSCVALVRLRIYCYEKPRAT